jgi:hypothetical protein
MLKDTPKCHLLNKEWLTALNRESCLNTYGNSILFICNCQYITIHFVTGV